MESHDGAAPAAVLNLYGDAAAALTTRDRPIEIVVLAWEGAAPLADLRRWLDALVRSHRRGTMHVVVVGGSSEIHDVLRKAGPFWQLGRSFSFTHVALGGSISHVRARPLPVLDQALARARDLAPLPPAALGQIAAQSPAREVDELVARLRESRPVATMVIGAVCVALFAIGAFWGGLDSASALWRMGANVPAAVRAGQWWRVSAAAFLHVNLVHLFVNMFALRAFGPFLERLLGRSRFVVLYGVSAWGGSVASTLLNHDVASAGASGALWGLMVAGIALALRPRGLLPPALVGRMKKAAAGPLIANLAISFIPGIDLYAHLGGGLLGGALVGAGLLTRGVRPVWGDGADQSGPAPSSAQRAGTWPVAAAVVATVLAVSVIVAIAEGRPWELRGSPSLARVPVADTGLSIEVPAGMSGAPSVTPVEGGRLFAYVNPSLDSTFMAVEVLVVPISRPVGPADITAELDQARRAMDQRSPSGMAAAGPARVDTVGGRSVVVSDYKIPGGTMRLWFAPLGANAVAVRIIARSERPPGWAALDARIAGSVRADSR